MLKNQEDPPKDERETLEQLAKEQSFVEYIAKDDAYWFAYYQNYLKGKKVLKVGNGLGYAGSLIRAVADSLSILEIEGSALDTKNQNLITIYDGETFPFEANSFDVVVTTYVLHHTPKPKEIIREMRRVSKKKLIILEETYISLESKRDLIARDIEVNKLAKQPSPIHRSSYFSQTSIRKTFEALKLDTEKVITEPKRSYLKELFILNTTTT